MFHLNLITMKKGFIFLSFVAFMLSCMVLRANPPVPSKGYAVESIINPVQDSVVALEIATVITVELLGYTTMEIRYSITGYLNNDTINEQSQIPRITRCNPIDYGLTYNVFASNITTNKGYSKNNKGSTIRKLIC